MSDKYTIKYEGEYSRIILNDKEICKVINHFECENMCRLLNENEARKNHPKIDEKFKKWVDRELKLTIAHRAMYIDKEQWSENISNLEKLNEIISNLPMEEV